MVALDLHESSNDARVLRSGRYSAWLKKAKSDNAKMKWITKSTTRYFTIDFDDKVFFYSHSESLKNVSHLTPFKNIVSAERLPPPAKVTKKHTSSHGCGFIVRTQDRTFELYATSNADAAQWVYALNAAREIEKLGQNGDVAAQNRATQQHVFAQREGNVSASREEDSYSNEGRFATRPQAELGINAPLSPSPLPPITGEIFASCDAGTRVLEHSAPPCQSSANECNHESPEDALENLCSSLNEERLAFQAASTQEKPEAGLKTEEECRAREALEAVQRAEEEEEKDKQRLACEAAQAKRIEEERLVAEAAQKAEEERLAREAAVAAQKAEEERLAHEAAVAAQKAEEERLAREAAVAAQNAEEERLAREAAAAQKVKEEERLAGEAAVAAQKAEEERLAREVAESAQKAEEQRLAREAAESAQKAEEQRSAREAAETAQKAEEQRFAHEAAEAAQNAEDEERCARDAAQVSQKTDEDCLNVAKSENRIQEDNLTNTTPGAPLCTVAAIVDPAVDTMAGNCRNDETFLNSSPPPPPVQESKERIPCPHCGRHFGVKQAEKHINICKISKTRPTLKPVAKPALRISCQGRAPKEVSKAATKDAEQVQEGSPEDVQPSGWDSDEEGLKTHKKLPEVDRPKEVANISKVSACGQKDDAAPSGWDSDDDNANKPLLQQKDAEPSGWDSDDDKATKQLPQQKDAPPSNGDSDDNSRNRSQEPLNKKPLPLALDFGMAGSKPPEKKVPLKLEFDMCRTHKPVPKKLAERLSRRSKKSVRKEEPPAEPAPSGWDSDDDKTKASASRKGLPCSADACGAPSRQPGEKFIAALPKPPAKLEGPCETSEPSNGLHHLVNEVLTVDSKDSDEHELVPNFQCTSCDHQVLRIDGYVWAEEVDYMFFRNNYPEVMKLRKQLKPQKGCCAYCCQCSSRSADTTVDLTNVAEGLRWKVIGA